MNFKALIPFCCLAVVFVSCSHVYEPALYHQDIAYQPKPMSIDSAKSATYISVGLNNYTNSNSNDFLESLQINVSRGYVFKHFNLAYGAFGVAGDYQNSAIDAGKPNYFTDKFFGAFGARASANAFVTTATTDFRYIGVEMAYSHEFGSYSDFRQYLNTQPGYYVDTRNDLFTVGLSTEVIYRSTGKHHVVHGFRGFFGTTLGYNNLNSEYYNNPNVTKNITPILTLSPIGNFFPKFSYFIKIKSFFGTAEIGNDFFLRFGYCF
jgi:hypothetical protein